jgi:hypothetical protein
MMPEEETEEASQLRMLQEQSDRLETQLADLKEEVGSHLSRYLLEEELKAIKARLVDLEEFRARVLEMHAEHKVAMSDLRESAQRWDGDIRKGLRKVADLDRDVRKHLDDSEKGTKKNGEKLDQVLRLIKATKGR